MSIIERIRRIAQANINTLLDDVETPEQELESKIHELEEAAREAKDALASFAVTYKRLEKNLADLAGRRDECRSRAEKAVVAGDDGLARRALAEKMKIDERIESLEPVRDSRQKTYDELKDDLVRVHDHLNHARARMADLRARRRAAQAEKAMGRQIDTAATMSDANEAFDRFEDDVFHAEAESEIARELRGEISDPAKKMDDEVRNQKVDEELEALKKKIGA